MKLEGDAMEPINHCLKRVLDGVVGYLSMGGGGGGTGMDPQ